MYAITPEKRVPFSFTVPKTLYDETRNKMQTRIIQFVDPFSTLGNGYSFEMELQPCLPGFKYEDHTQGCVCDTDHFGVQRYSKNKIGPSESKTKMTTRTGFSQC